MFTSLMSTCRFAPLFLCQFFAAFGDNFLKTALGFLIVYQLSDANSPALVQLASATFIAPYFFLSGLGGELADRFDKGWVAQRVKFVEMGVAAAYAVAGFAFHSLSLLFVALFLFGVLGSLFGPVKYDNSRPTSSAREELAAGNALIEGGTFLAIGSGDWTFCYEIRTRPQISSGKLSVSVGRDVIAWDWCFESVHSENTIPKLKHTETSGTHFRLRQTTERQDIRAFTGFGRQRATVFE